MNIYVGNLPIEMTGDELRRFFNVFGEVTSVIMMNDKYIGSGQPRGYGYVRMASRDEGAAAIATLEGKTLRDRVINVVEALPLSNKEISYQDGVGIPDIKNKRFNKKRERIADYLSHPTLIMALGFYFARSINEFRNP